MPTYLISIVVLALQTMVSGSPVSRVTVPVTPPAAITQVRKKPAPSAAAAQKKTGKDYSQFNHETTEHKGACNSCHKIPTATATGKPNRKYPDITDYPTHSTCLQGCHTHREHFFKGANPQICKVCHLAAAPTAEARNDFPNLTRKSQFTDLFPHDKHQDIIASLLPKPGSQPSESFRFVPTNLVINGSGVADNKKSYNTCEICHAADKAHVDDTKIWPPKGLDKKFYIFKASPDQHNFCFSCHWDKQKPTRDQCELCHQRSLPHERPELPRRDSAKFRHGSHDQLECTVCHINITKSGSLDKDVPLTACTPCHAKPKPLTQVNDEIDSRIKNSSFTCEYCHLANIGRCDPPEGHWLAAKKALKPTRPCPK